jgi:hypothetical protein
MKNIIKSITFYFKLFVIVGFFGVIVALYLGNFIIIDWSFLKSYDSKINKLENTDIDICLCWNACYKNKIFEKKKIIKSVLSQDILSVSKMWTVFALQECGVKSTVKNVSVGNNLCVIEVEIDDKKKLYESIIFEWNFFESFKKTIFSSFPSIQEVYFYEKNNILIPKNFIYSPKKNYFLSKLINDNFFDQHEKINIFPLINIEKKGDSNAITIFNFFQKEKLENDHIFLFSGQKNYENELIRKINSKNGDRNCFLNVFFGEKNYVALIFYDFGKNKFYIEKKEILDESFFEKKVIKIKNKDGIKEFCGKNSFDYFEFEIPSIPILTTFRESFVVEVCIKNKNELNKVSDLIELLI